MILPSMRCSITCAAQPLVRAARCAAVHTFVEAEALGEHVAAALRAGGAVWAANSPAA